MKQIKYEFFKTTKFIDKSNKIWMHKSNFVTIFCRGTFSNVLQKIVEKLKSLSIN